MQRRAAGRRRTPRPCSAYRPLGLRCRTARRRVGSSPSPAATTSWRSPTNLGRPQMGARRPKARPKVNAAVGAQGDIAPDRTSARTKSWPRPTSSTRAARPRGISRGGQGGSGRATTSSTLAAAVLKARSPSATTSSTAEVDDVIPGHLLPARQAGRRHGPHGPARSSALPTPRPAERRWTRFLLRLGHHHREPGRRPRSCRAWKTLVIAGGTEIDVLHVLDRRPELGGLRPRSPAAACAFAPATRSRTRASAPMPPDRDARRHQPRWRWTTSPMVASATRRRRHRRRALRPGADPGLPRGRHAGAGPRRVPASADPP